MSSKKFTRWRKSTRSESGDQCVEVAVADDRMRDAIGIRDSKHKLGPVLEFGPAEWARFVQTIRTGEYDMG